MLDLGGSICLFVCAPASRPLSPPRWPCWFPERPPRPGRAAERTLRTLVTPLLASLAGPDGLDIEVDVFHGGRHYVHLSQVRTEGLGWIRDVVNGVDGQVTPLAETAGTALDLALVPANGELLTSTALRASWPPPTAPGEAPFTKRDKPFPGVTCTRYKKVNMQPLSAMTTVASGVVRNGARIETLYTEAAESTLSTGFSFDHGATFSINGARIRGAEFKAEFVGRAAGRGKVIARDFRLEHLHNLMRRVCLGNNYNDYRVQYVTSPDRSTYGVDDIASKYPTWSCRPGDGKTSRALATRVGTTNKKAATYEAAFGFSPLGAGLFEGRALSGYSEHVAVDFSFANPERGYWCGHTADPGAKGQRLQGFEL